MKLKGGETYEHRDWFHEMQGMWKMSGCLSGKPDRARRRQKSRDPVSEGLLWCASCIKECPFEAISSITLVPTSAAWEARWPFIRKEICYTGELKNDGTIETIVVNKKIRINIKEEDHELTISIDALEAEAIYIIREVAAECEKPVMLYSIGKDSSVMLHLAMKAFYPEKPPFPFLHVNTTWKFKETDSVPWWDGKETGINMIDISTRTV